MKSSAVIFIQNPRAGNASQHEIARRLQASVENRFVWHTTTAPKELGMLAKEAAEAHAKVVVAVGGDGTVHEVANGLMSVDKSRRPALAVLPLGSGNDFAFAAGIPRDPIDALDVAIKGKPRVFDVGAVSTPTGLTRHWINTCGIGLNAKIAIRSHDTRSPNKKPNYLLAALSAIWNDSSPIEMEIAIDESPEKQAITLLTLGNGPREGGGFLMAPGAKIDDGKLDLLRVHRVSRLGLLGLLPSSRKGKHLRSRSVSYAPFTSLHIRSTEPLAIHTDGEIFAAPENNVCEITARVCPGAMQVIA